MASPVGLNWATWVPFRIRNKTASGAKLQMKTSARIELNKRERKWSNLDETKMCRNISNHKCYILRAKDKLILELSNRMVPKSRPRQRTT